MIITKTVVLIMISIDIFPVYLFCNLHNFSFNFVFYCGNVRKCGTCVCLKCQRKLWNFEMCFFCLCNTDFGFKLQNDFMCIDTHILFYMSK